MKPQDIKLTYENNRSIFWDIYNMPFGKERRQCIIEYLRQKTPEIRTCLPYGLYVNCKYQIQVNSDPDIEYMIKKGILIFDSTKEKYNTVTLSSKYIKGYQMKLHCNKCNMAATKDLYKASNKTQFRNK